MEHLLQFLFFDLCHLDFFAECFAFTELKEHEELVHEIFKRVHVVNVQHRVFKEQRILIDDLSP